MRRCRVSMTGEDGEEHALETEAASLMDAAYAGVQAWAKTSWWRPEAAVRTSRGDSRKTHKANRIRRRHRQGRGRDSGRIATEKVPTRRIN